MDYNYIESLVIKAKDGDIISKEKLAEEFRPYIINLSKKTFIHGYDFSDIKSECYKYLYKCLSFYNSDTHRFVAYATRGIRNNLNDLIRKNLNNSKVNASLISSRYDYIFTNITSDINIEETYCEEVEKQELKTALNLLCDDEKEIINNIYFNNGNVKNYAEEKNISYYYASKQKRKALNKISKYFSKKELLYS